ncbi:MAG: L,D-transpeptidase [Bacillota bacterium]
MRLTRFVLALTLLAIGLFGAPWWVDLAADLFATPEPEPTAAPALAAAPVQETQTPVPELWVDVDQKRQLVSVYEGDRALRIMLASTGITSSPTPNGIYRVHERGEWFYSDEFEQGAYYWVGLDQWGEYLFHSVPFTRERELIEEEASLLGQPASHGCIRLSLEDAKWVYDHIPTGSRVVIHDR